MTKEDWSFINNLEDPNLEKKFNDLTKKYLNQAFDTKKGINEFRKLYLLQDRMLQNNWMAKLTISESDPDKQLMSRFKTAFYLLDNTGMIDDFYRLFGKNPEQEKKIYTLIATIMKRQMDNDREHGDSKSSILSRVTQAITGKHFKSILFGKDITKGGNNNGKKYEER